jgi:uncharacterized protein YggT (Ycf19 family)
VNLKRARRAGVYGRPMATSTAQADRSGSTTALRFAKGLVWLVYGYFVLAVIILVLAFFLLLFNANTDASFTEWVYRSANRVLEPFRGIFPAVTADNGSVLDFAVLFAIVMYGIFALVVHAVVSWLDQKIRSLD